MGRLFIYFLLFISPFSYYLFLFSHFQAQFLPESIGIPIGGDEPLRFIRMETHYDNPELRSGKKDWLPCVEKAISILQNHHIFCIQSD